MHLLCRLVMWTCQYFGLASKPLLLLHQHLIKSVDLPVCIVQGQAQLLLNSACLKIPLFVVFTISPPLIAFLQGCLTLLVPLLERV